jgi:hypothetical protein
MYCPRCGQQAFDEVRFCSRCGFRLDGVTVLLDQDGSIVPPPIQSQANEVSPRQKGIRLGAKLIFLSIILFPIFMAISVSRDVDSPAPLLVPLTAFLLGLTRLLYSVIFEAEWSPARPAPQPLRGKTAKPNAALSPPPASMASLRPVNTADMLQSPSVTENTTNLLEKK